MEMSTLYTVELLAPAGMNENRTKTYLKVISSLLKSTTLIVADNNQTPEQQNACPLYDDILLLFFRLYPFILPFILFFVEYKMRKL